MKKTLTLLLTLAFSSLYAQISTPALSPLSSVEQRVGLTDISLEYSRPSMKGRTIFGDLVPYGVMWRTGANASTKLSFNQEVSINGETVPAGTYALYTIPGESEWTFILHNNLRHWGTGGSSYNQEEDQLRFTAVANNKCAESVESFSINFANLSSNSCDLELRWANTSVGFKINVSYDEQVMKQIEDAMNISPGTYYSAARYYLENGKDLNQALEWITIASEETERFWYLRQKSLIEAELGMFDDAIETAKRSLELAQEAENASYIKMNTESIKEWSETNP